MLLARVATVFIGFGMALSGLGQSPQTTLTPIPTTKQAEHVSTPPVPTTPATGHTLDAADVGAFFDGILPMQLERSDIAGASVLVMKDGQTLLKKGYGYADQKAKKP